MEAPHLTSLYEKYRSKGFTVLAVNAYDESRETVDAFVKSRKLTHPILLMGGDVASEKFLVQAYPTAYWIGRDGKIIERTVGFGEGGEKKLEAKLLALLRKSPTQD